MPRYSSGALTTAGSTTLPIIALAASSTVGAKVREIGVTNTTATAVALKLVRLTTAGTPGTALVETAHAVNAPAASCTAANTYSSTGPTLVDLGYRASLGAAIGSGVIWTFGDSGLEIDAGTANGIGVVVENGTGQACQAYIVWDE